MADVRTSRSITAVFEHKILRQMWGGHSCPPKPAACHAFGFMTHRDCLCRHAGEGARATQTRSHCGGGFSFQFFGLIVADQRFDQGLEFTVHDLLKLVNGHADAVVGDSVLRKIVGADFFAAVT
jgi:hypothetical protein